MSSDIASSIWAPSARPVHPRLDQDLVVDVVVVGAGIAGVSVAWELSRAGHDVALLDSSQVGCGVTGHSTGKVTAVQGVRYSALERRLGARASARYAESQLLAMEHLAAIVHRLKIDGALTRQPAYLFAEDEAALPALTAEVKSARAAGIDMRFSLKTGLPFPTAGAAVIAGQIALDPQRYVAAVAADLVHNGGRIYEDTTVTGLDEGTPHRIRTADGPVVSAGHVVVTTQFPIFDRALLFPHLHPRREFVLVADAPPGSVPAMYNSVGKDVRSVRISGPGSPDQLIVTGAPFSPGGDAAPGRLADLQQWADERFQNPSWTASWAAQDYDTPDGLPFIGPLHRFGKNLWAATGFGGWGLSNGALAGILIRDLIEGRESPHASLFHTRRLAPLVVARSLISGSPRLAHGMVGDRVRSQVTSIATTSELPVGEAAYLRDAGIWAAYRDDSGGAHVVSASCTHQGCRVTFNEAETTWECPCHGSRFSVDGDVLQGPATTPLEPHPELDGS